MTDESTLGPAGHGGKAFTDLDGNVVVGEPVQAEEPIARQESPAGTDLEPIAGAIDLAHLIDREAHEKLEVAHHVVRASRLVHATPEDCFAIVQDPMRHDEIEAKAMIVEALDREPVEAAGESFRMAMHADHLGDYVMVNHVTEFEQDRRIAWKPVMEGKGDPVGFRWTWSFEPGEEEGTTMATLQYDWLDVTNEKFLAKRQWPTFEPEHYLASVRALAAAAEQHDAA